MNNELMNFDELEIKPSELSGNGLSGNGNSDYAGMHDYDLYLSELSF